MVVSNANSVVKDLIQDNQQIWLDEWLQKYVVLKTINHIHLIDMDDRLCWKYLDGSVRNFLLVTFGNLFVLVVLLLTGLMLYGFLKASPDTLVLFGSSLVNV